MNYLIRLIGEYRDYKFVFTNYEELLEQFPRSVEAYWSRETFGVVVGWFFFNVRYRISFGDLMYSTKSQFVVWYIVLCNVVSLCVLEML